MNHEIEKVFPQCEEKLIHFVQKLVQTQSYSDNEGDVAHCIEAEMKQLGYDEVFIDRVGNVVGRIGDGPKIIQFDSHMDTVEVHDADKWEVPPFSGEIKDGVLWGRGSVDMKSALASSVYAAALAKKMGYLEGKKIYITGTVCEEFCDGENLKMLYADYHEIRPDYVVICEPSDNIITVGHKGKAQIRIKTRGVSAHGSAPEKGVNAVYEMAEIIQHVEALNKRLSSVDGAHGTIVLSDISCISASLNAVPSECEIYLDRRMVLGETKEHIQKEMDSLIEGKNAFWEIGTLHHTSWTGAKLNYDPMHLAWEIAKDHELTKACNKAHEEIFVNPPKEYDFWDFGTNAITPVAMGIPTIGFGPGEYKLAHMRNEHCSVDKIKDACKFYSCLIKNL